MKSSFWTPYISDHTIHAICWTLIHSLWIGLAIALIAGLVITLTKKSSAALRYNLLCGVLVLFTLSAWVTFFIEMRAPAIEQGPFQLGQIINAPGNHLMIIPATTAPHLSLFTRIVWLLNEYANVIFLAWLLLFVLKSLKMAGALLYIQRIRNYKVHEVSEEFKHKIEVYAGQIGIRQVVRLVQSELVKVPVAVGWLKPVILLPMGILLQLSPEQLESILWHELAHIRRRDYLVNILQGLVETIFFFNPGLLWLSSLIRAEREACCDDIVLSRMDRKANYLEALLAFGNEDNSCMPLAMSVGSGNQLRDRLKRMINKENKRLNVAEKVVLIAGLIVLSAFTTLPKTTQNAVKRLVDVVVNKHGHVDTLKLKTTVLDSATKQSRTFRQTEVISRDTVHGKANVLGPFKSVLFKNSDADPANNDISAEDTTGKRYHFIVADNKLVAMDINGEKVQENDLPKYQYMITQIYIAVLEKRHIRETDMARFKASHPDIKFTAGGAFEKKHFINPRFYKDSVYNADLQKMNEIIADLVARKVVTGADAVKWFALTDSEFIVDGEKQSDELQQRYKAQYGVHEGYGLYYGPVPMKGKGVFIDPGLSKERRSSDSIRS
ncbi:MAG TPA: M56 family metallopeptidase, partial [Mucilaginibacter sp.]|nr:M56 family metallopeptidase [Mucilaginibacter sp.]